MDPGLLALYDLDQRRRLRPPPGRRRREDAALVRIEGPTAHALDQMVCWSSLTEADADAAIRALADEADLGWRAVQWNVFGHDQPTDLVERLERQAFEVTAREQVLVLATGAARSDGASRAALEVRRVAHERDLDPVVAIQQAVWGNSHTEWILAWWRPALRGEGDPIAIFVVWIDGRPAGFAWVLLPRGAPFANLFGASVLPEFRRRGVHRALVAARAEAAAAAGIPWMVVEANANSAPLLLRQGFAPITTRTELVRAARAQK